MIIIIDHILDNPVSTELACFTMIPSGFACGILNAVTLSLMAIDRQDCVLRPFNRRMTRSNIKKVIAISWAGTLVLTCVIIFQSPNDQFDACGVIPKIKGRDPVFVYFGILTLSFNIGSVFTIVITACRIIKSLRHVNRVNDNNSNKIIKLSLHTTGLFPGDFPCLPYTNGFVPGRSIAVFKRRNYLRFPLDCGEQAWRSGEITRHPNKARYLGLAQFIS